MNVHHHIANEIDDVFTGTRLNASIIFKQQGMPA